EDQLVVAQTQRRKTSKVQAFWAGYGNGDGIEASELANVRGEKEAVRRAMDKKACHTPAGRAAAAAANPAAASAPAPVITSTSGRTDWRSWATQPQAAPATQVLYKCPRADGSEVIVETPAAGCTVLQTR